MHISSTRRGSYQMTAAGDVIQGGSARLIGMESKLAIEAERALVEATQRLSPEERVNAFLAHCRLVMELYEAGQKMRARTSQPPS
jgi:hypothetical protein